MTNFPGNPASQSVDQTLKEPEFEGVYGRYRITSSDEIEVKLYRFSVLVCSMSFCIGIIYWIFLGPNWAWLWLIPFATSLGFALKWIHIYLRPLHKTLWILWALGCLGILFMAFNLGTEKILPHLATERVWTLAIGPLFASLTGLGFKEFFCFRRPEAIGVTLLVPTSLIGHLSGVLNGTIVMALLTSSALLFFVLAFRKFGMDASADIGDKSIFNYLDNQQTLSAL